jgi:hypothetical protein
MDAFEGMEVGQSVEVLLNRGEADVWYPVTVRNAEPQEVEVMVLVRGMDPGRWITTQDIAEWRSA